MPPVEMERVRKTRVLAQDFPSLRSLGIEACGETALLGPYQQQLHRCGRWILHCCLEGQVAVRWEAGDGVFNSGDYLLTSADGAITYSHAGTSGRLVWLRWLPEHGGFDDTGTRQGSMATDGLEQAYSQLYRESCSQARPTLIYHMAAVYLELLRSQLNGENTRLTALWQEVDADLSHPWQLQELADVAGLGRERLRQLSLASCGRAPMQQLTWLRLRRAAQLLEEDALSVQAVADLVGYDNAFAFSRAFKRHMGCSPAFHRLG